MRFLLVFALLLTLFLNESSAQSSNQGNIELSGSLGPAFGGGKTSFYGNAELNYFMSSNMSLTAGYEYLQDRHSFILGNRIYFVPDFHFSMKGVLVSQTDFALGGGYSRGIADNVALQINGDWYFARKMFALSFGLAFRI
ncbi:hypothetical protein [Flammeovirga aprica]|uniref:Outer membrane protein beta-barrel domain-containing protein n=1 Tax=Flammeovirga aprica JL-4 TaxID=694437 RepID=A0A7X9RZX1_9BACT|nr:hypothetical protein [Flammeovirga aprica]NME71783.1 hypothetical protein [Flammeovirga aprica JL-4]